ncbi:MAG: glycosyltransferase family 4 protein [Deltaproteobacteria bacterium]|nr:glycosyltransferase family 4 protein [Nannocystaceae bacterium]
MRVLYLHQYFATPDMAGGTRSYEMARRLVEHGHEVDLLTSDQRPTHDGSLWRQTNESGVRVHWTSMPYDNRMSFRERLRTFMAFGYRASRKVLEFRPDVVFATSTPLTIAIPAIVAQRRFGVPMVFEVRDVWPAVPIALGALQNPLARKAALELERQAYRHATRIVALAPGMKAHVVGTGVPAERVDVIPNGCDLDIFTNDPRAGQEIRAANPWLADRPLVLFTGTLGAANGLEHLVRVAAKVHERAPQVCFAIIGDGRQREPLVALARELGVLDVNLFVLGKMPKREVARWVSAADITTAYFSGPPILWKDAVQNKFFDSLAAGKPVASNHRGWQSELALEAGCGLVMDPDDVELAAAQLLEVVLDRSWLDRAGAAARKLGETRFSRDMLGGLLDGTLRRAVDEYAMPRAPVWLPRRSIP